MSSVQLNLQPVVSLYKKPSLRKTQKRPKHLQIIWAWIKIINPKKTNIVIGCIYKHPGINLNEFNKFYLNNLLDKLSKENKTVFLLGDFNINPLNYDQGTSTNEFLDSQSSHLFLCCIFQPARVRSSSKTLISKKISSAYPPILYLVISLCLSKITFSNFS